MGLLIAAVALGILVAVFLLIVIWRATGNAFDWLVETFGNDAAAERIRRKRSPGRGR